MKPKTRDHGGGLDAACLKYGGSRIEWIDLSTGINPQPYPVPKLSHDTWSALPDQGAYTQLCQAARQFWAVPDDVEILAAPGASVLIAQMPTLHPQGTVNIPAPTYNEHGAAFSAQGWTLHNTADADAQVIVHPNNPDGKRWTDSPLPVPNATLTIIDESFCDTQPDQTLMHRASLPGTLVLKSFGKFWGLAGLRLGFVMGDPALLATLRAKIGPWAVAGPAVEIGTRALRDLPWAETTRVRLANDSARLDALMTAAGAACVGGTPLFRLYEVEDAAAWQHRLAQHRIWSRVFPYNAKWVRLGLPSDIHWPRVEAALR